MLDLVGELNEREMRRSLDPEVRTRIAQAETAYRMQMAVPDLVDFSDESEATLAMYGPEVQKPGSFAANCLLARRLAERGVRFIQLYMRGWDAHNNLPQEIRDQCRAVDQPQAALVLRPEAPRPAGGHARDLGRRVRAHRLQPGRAHHDELRPRPPPAVLHPVARRGGRPAGRSAIGRTDDYSYNIVENPVDVHDLHATLLHLLGIDHQRLVYRHEGRDHRLTDVFGKVRPELFA